MGYHAISEATLYGAALMCRTAHGQCAMKMAPEAPILSGLRLERLLSAFRALDIDGNATWSPLPRRAPSRRRGAL